MPSRMSTIAAASRLGRRQVGALLPEVAGFDAVTEAEVVTVSLPRDQGPAPRSKTVQEAAHPNLVPTTLRPMHSHHVAVIPGARLATSSGAVITADGRLVLETLWDRPHWERSFDPPPALPAAHRVRGRHASIISVWCHNFHHWMFEALPRLAVLQASGVKYDRLIVPENLTAFQQETLELAGIPGDRLLPFTGEHIEPDELVWSTPPAPFEQPTPYVVEWLRSVAGLEDPDPTMRFYIPRRGARKVTNEDQVLAVLRSAGFQVLEPEGLSLREQIARFSSARWVVGPHGAAFSNAIFSRRLGALEFFHDHHVNVSTTAATAAAGHEHWSLMCPRKLAPRRRRNQDLRVPLGALEESLAAMGAL
jgi:capsular polysaccharide biosynthesis protein